VIIANSRRFSLRIEDYICEENPVRVVDAFVDELNLFELGFASAEPKATGRPGYHPSTMLKLISMATSIKFSLAAI